MGKTYAAVRLAMTTGGQLTDADAAERLVTAWNPASTSRIMYQI